MYMLLFPLNAIGSIVVLVMMYPSPYPLIPSSYLCAVQLVNKVISSNSSDPNGPMSSYSSKSKIPNDQRSTE